MPRVARRPAEPAVAAPAVTGQRRSGATVTVACKIAIARLELQLQRKVQVWEQTQAGPRQISQYVKEGIVWVVRGTAYPAGQTPRGFIDRPQMVDGYALTPGIPADFWEAWVEQNKLTDLVKSNLIYASPDRDDIAAFASDYTDMKCALAPLDMPQNESDPLDARVPRSMTPGVENIQKLKT